MGLKDNLSSMYDSAADSAKNLGNRAMETAKDVSENEVFKAVVFDKDDPVDVALTAAGAVTGGASIGAKAIYKGAKVAKAASKVFKSEKVADTALTIGKKIGSGAEAAKDVFSKGKEAVSGKISGAADSASGIFSKSAEYLGKKVEQGKEAASKIVSEGMEKASEMGTKAKEAATDVFQRSKDYASKKIEQGTEAAKDVFNRGKDLAGKKLDEAKEGAQNLWKKGKDAGKKGLDDAFDMSKKVVKKAGDLGKKVFRKTAGLAGGLAGIFGGSDEEDQSEEEDQGSPEAPKVVTGAGKVSPASAITPNITPPENIETSAAEMTPIGEGGAGGLGDARSILEKIYMVLQQTNRTVEKISADTGNLVRYSSMKDAAADLAGANVMARSGEGMVYGGGGGSSYSSYSGSTDSGGKKEKEDGFFSSILKKAGATGLTAAGLYGLGGGFDETPMLDEAGGAITEKASEIKGSIVEKASEIGGSIKSGYSKVKNFLGFGEDQKGPTTEEVKKISKEIMPQTTKTLEGYEGLGSISAKYESGGRGAGTISSGKGDLGGASYGTHQLASKTGTLQQFLNTSGYGKEFQGLTPGSQEFNAKWKEIATKDKNFGEAQHTFIKQTHYDPQMKKLQKSGIDLSTKGKSVQEAVFSTSTQFGGGTSLIQKALSGKDTASMSDEEIVSAIQDYKIAHNEQLFKSSDSKQRAGTLSRAKKEKEDLLQIAKSKDNKLDKNLSVAEKKSDSIISNPPAQEPVVLAQNTTAKANEATKSNSSAPAQKSMNMTEGKQSGNDSQPLGNVRDDDPLILSMQYSNLRTV